MTGDTDSSSVHPTGPDENKASKSHDTSESYNFTTPARAITVDAEDSISDDQFDNDSDIGKVDFNSVTDFRTAISTPGHPLAEIEHLLPDELIEILMEEPKFPTLKSRSSDELTIEGDEVGSRFGLGFDIECLKICITWRPNRNRPN